MPCALLRVGKKLRQAAMEPAALGSRGLGVDSGGKQRMGEADALPVQFDDMCLEGRREPVGGPSTDGAVHQLERGLRHRRRREQRRPGSGW